MRTVRKFLSEGNFTLLDLRGYFRKRPLFYPFAHYDDRQTLGIGKSLRSNIGASCVPTRPCGKPCLRASPFPRSKPGEPDPGATALRSNGFTRDYRPTAIRPSRWGPTALRHEPSFIQEWADTIALFFRFSPSLQNLGDHQANLPHATEGKPGRIGSKPTSELIAGTSSERSRQSGTTSCNPQETTQKLIAVGGR